MMRSWLSALRPATAAGLHRLPATRRALCAAVTRRHASTSTAATAEAAPVEAAPVETATVPVRVKYTNPANKTLTLAADPARPFISSPSTMTHDEWQTLKNDQKALYDQVDLNLYPLKSAPFMHDLWLSSYTADRALRATHRSLIAQNTFHITKHMEYSINVDGKVFDISLSVPVVKNTLKGTRVIESSSSLKLKPVDEPKESDVRVLNADPIDIAFDLKRAGKNPLVLQPTWNDAGGFWMTGGGVNKAQGDLQYDMSRGTEEDIYRRTTIARAIRPRMYPFPDAGAAYAPNVIVFRAGMRDGYRLLAEPFTLSFIAMQQIHKPRLLEEQNGNFIFRDMTASKLRRKFRTFLRVAKANGHDAVVIPGFGSGNFKNPARHVASIWKGVFEEREFANQLPTVRFGINDDFAIRQNWMPDGTLRPYLEVFGGPDMTGFVPPAIFEPLK